MKNKFKNNIYVTGPLSLLEAFEKELKTLGYTNSSPSYNAEKLSIGTYQHGNYQYLNFNNEGEYLLPRDWDKALKLASEKELPAYVKLLKDWSVNSEYIGEVFELSTLDNLHKFQCAPSKVEFRENILQWVEVGYFIESTKEEFEEQQKANSSKYKVGDFITSDDGSVFYYITEVTDKEYKYWREFDKRNTSAFRQIIDSASFLNKVSDEQALIILKRHYAKEGIVGEARIQYGNAYEKSVYGFDLLKNANPHFRNYGEASEIRQGDSQLVIYINSNKHWITPTTTGFKVLPKEVEVAGYKVEVKKNPGYDHTMIKIGCQWYTKDSLITIRDLIKSISNITNKYRFQHYTAGFIEVTVDELNGAIKLFDK